MRAYARCQPFDRQAKLAQGSRSMRILAIHPCRQKPRRQVDRQGFMQGESHIDQVSLPINEVAVAFRIDRRGNA